MVLGKEDELGWGPVLGGVALSPLPVDRVLAGIDEPLPVCLHKVVSHSEVAVVSGLLPRQEGMQ